MTRNSKFDVQVEGAAFVVVSSYFEVGGSCVRTIDRIMIYTKTVKLITYQHLDKHAHKRS